LQSQEKDKHDALDIQALAGRLSAVQSWTLLTFSVKRRHPAPILTHNAVLISEVFKLSCTDSQSRMPG